MPERSERNGYNYENLGWLEDGDDKPSPANVKRERWIVRKIKGFVKRQQIKWFSLR